LTIIDPNGVKMKIPSWMTMPQAANHRLAERAAICPRAILFLSDLVEMFLEKNDVTI
jgi:hypothetical protein